MPLRAVIVAFVIGAMLLAVSPVFAAPPGGTGPGDAVQLAGIQSGTLATSGEFWYQFSDSGTSLPLGVDLTVSPPDIDLTSGNNPMVSFEVWDFEKVGLNLMLTQIGRGTTNANGIPMDVRYWRGGTNVAKTYFIRVFNNAPVSISYAISFIGSQFPPPELPITPGAAPGPAPSPVPAPPPPVPSPVAPTPTGGGTSPDTAVTIDGVMTGRITSEHVWYTFFYTDSDTAEGLVMNFQPTTVEDPTVNANVVSFNVWATVCTTGGVNNCALTKIGAGTRSGQPGGVKYWRISSGTAKTYFIEVFNNSGDPISYALALAGSTYPPGGLVVPPL